MRGHEVAQSDSESQSQFEEPCEEMGGPGQTFPAVRESPKMGKTFVGTESLLGVTSRIPSPDPSSRSPVTLPITGARATSASFQNCVSTAPPSTSSGQKEEPRTGKPVRDLHAKWIKCVHITPGRSTCRTNIFAKTLLRGLGRGGQGHAREHAGRNCANRTPAFLRFCLSGSASSRYRVSRWPIARWRRQSSQPWARPESQRDEAAKKRGSSNETKLGAPAAAACPSLPRTCTEEQLPGWPVATSLRGAGTFSPWPVAPSLPGMAPGATAIRFGDAVLARSCAGLHVGPAGTPPTAFAEVTPVGEPLPRQRVR